jgi:hypothetical protein
MGGDFVLLRFRAWEVIQGIERQRQEERAAADRVQIAEDGPLMEWIAVGVERAEGDPQGGEAPKGAIRD